MSRSVFVTSSGAKREIADKTPCTTTPSASAEKWLGSIGFAIGIF